MRLIGALLLAIAGGAWADTPAALAARYGAEAASAQPKYASSADAGRDFFLRRFNVSADFPSCSTCHTDNPAARGKHAITGKLSRRLHRRPTRNASPMLRGWRNGSGAIAMRSRVASARRGRRPISSRFC